MRNTPKLKNILQLFTINLDIDDDGCFHLTSIHKRTGRAETFINKSYTTVIEKAYSRMLKELKWY